MQLNNPIENLAFARRGAQTKRYHANRMLEHQSVGEHSYQVAMICNWLASQNPPGVGVALIMAALTHDIAEHVMGDLPAPTKRKLPDCFVDDGRDDYVVSFRDAWGELETKLLTEHQLNWENLLTDQEKHWLALADAADGCLHCVQERAMGNRLIDTTWKNYISYFGEIRDVNSKAETILYDYIYGEWLRASQ